MPSFDYRGRDNSGKAVQGTIEAESELQAADMLMRHDILPTALRQRAAHSLNINWDKLWQSHKNNRQNIQNKVIHLSTTN